MNLTNVTRSLTRVGNAALRTLEHYAPKILVGTGIFCGVAATVTACKATLKLQDTMADISANVETAKSTVTEDADDEKVKNREIAKSYISGGVKLAKLYAPAIAFGITSTVCVLAGNHLMNQRYAGAVAALTTSEKMFSEYRRCVVDELGVDKDVQFSSGVKKIVSEETVLNKDGTPKTDKNGEVKTVEKTTYEGYPEHNKYARMFDEVSSERWDKHPDYNKTTLLGSEQYFNQQLREYKYLFLNDVYRQLGFPITSYGQDMGWIVDADTPDPIVDLGIRAIDPETGCRVIDNMDYKTNAVWLTFDGVRYIKDKVWRVQRVF